MTEHAICSWEEKKIMEENENEENKSRDDSMDQKERDQDSSDGIIL